MKCAVCRSFYPRNKDNEWFEQANTYTGFVLCSWACLKLYLNGVGKVIDKTDLETHAIAATLKPLGEFLGEIGWDKSFKDLTREQVLQLAEVVVDGFQGYLRVTSDDVPF